MKECQYEAIHWFFATKFSVFVRMREVAT